MNRIATSENRNGEPLSIEFDLPARKYLINGMEVMRQQPLETSNDEYVFSTIGAGTQRLFHVTVADLKILWGKNK